MKAHKSAKFSFVRFGILESGREVDLAMWKQVHTKEARVDDTTAKNVRMNARKKDVK